MSASFSSSPEFPEAAAQALRNSQLRANLSHATATIRTKRDRAVGELPDFEELRRAAERVKDDALANLPALLRQLEAQLSAAGGHVHYARDAAEACAVVTRLVASTGSRSVVKVKSMTTAEIGLNDALEASGIAVTETDLAELIVQLGDDLPSHIVVPAIHRNRAEIRETFRREMGRRGRAAPHDLSDEPGDLAAAARSHLRERLLTTDVAISGANFAVAESGGLVVVESEGNGRMCLTLAKTLISVVGIDKVIPSFADLEIFLQLLPRSATGERMNPYTSIWTGPTEGDGPTDVHLVLLDNGRSNALGDHVGRQALRCIRCAACLNVCPVYERVGGHAYGSVYPGPIGAVLAPQLSHVASDQVAASLPFASTLCGACFEVCPVRIDIPRLLVHLRGEVVDAKRARGATVEGAAMAVAGYVLEDSRRLARVERVGARLARLVHRGPRVRRLPGALGGWTETRDAPLPAAQSFRDWWLNEHQGPGEAPTTSPPPPRPASPTRLPDVARLVTSLASFFTVRRVERRVEGARPRHDDARNPRDAVLDAVERALQVDSTRSGAGAPAASPAGEEAPRAYDRAGSRHLDHPFTLFGERLLDYKANVVTVAPADLAREIVAVLEGQGARSVVVPADVPRSWLEMLATSAIEVVMDSPALAATDLDTIDAAITGCAVAIAETGTIILDGGTAQGRRALSLVPDALVVVVTASQVVAGVPDAVALLSPAAPQTWISGPSATSDIELNRVEGVHGPRRLDVLLVDDTSPG